MSLYGVSADDFAKITTRVQQFMADFANWQVPVQAYYGRLHASKQLPDMNTIKAFRYQRQSLVKAYYDRLHGQLTGPGWQGLYGYINGNFKQGVTP